MADHTIEIFKSGVQNLLAAEVIPKDAAQDSQNWITQDGRLKLSYGRKLIGQDGLVGKISGLKFGYKVDGSKVFFRKVATKIQYLNGSTWTDIITNLTENADYTFANYSSLAGASTIIAGIDGIWKVINAVPFSPIQLLTTASPYRGKIMIDKGRMFLWDRADNKTTLFTSYTDTQKVGAQYTAVTGEATASLGGTLAFKAGGATRSCFGVKITLTGTGEIFTDNYLGTLTGTLGGTGTINYATGAYTLSHSGTGTANYTWENPNSKGLTDFSSSATRLAGEGAYFQQDLGGDAILNVLVGQDGNYYSMKSQSSYKLTIDNIDTTFSNTVYRTEIGIPFFRASISTNKGIVFMNTANPDKPELTILQRNPIGDNIEPVVLFPGFKFSNYDYSDCSIDTWERYIVIACKKKGSVNNDTILLGDIAVGTLDIVNYSARMFEKNDGNLYVGSPITENVYQIFNGFDDDSSKIQNYWKGNDERYKKLSISEKLKRNRKIRMKGLISPDQAIEIYDSYDGAGFALVGTIVGSGSYVDYSSPQSIGSNMIGEAQIGGDDTVFAYPYFTEIKVKPPKFRSRTRMLIAKGIGYVDIQFMSDWDILVFEQRLPSRFRQKQHVSLDGLETNISHQQVSGVEESLLETEDDSFIEL